MVESHLKDVLYHVYLRSKSGSYINICFLTTTSYVLFMFDKSLRLFGLSEPVFNSTFQD